MVPRGKAEHLPRMTGTEPVGTEPVGWVSAGSLYKAFAGRVAALLLTLHFRHCHHLLFGKGAAGKRAWLRNDMLIPPY